MSKINTSKLPAFPCGWERPEVDCSISRPNQDWYIKWQHSSLTAEEAEGLARGLLEAAQELRRRSGEPE